MDETTAVVNEIKKNINDLSVIDKNGYFYDLYQKGVLTDNVIEFLIKYDIGLSYLAHLPLSDNNLIKIYLTNRQVCEEAAFTLIDRVLKNNITIQDFNNIFSQCCNESVSEYLFGSILLKQDFNELLQNKIFDAIHYIKRLYLSNENIYITAVVFEIFLKLRQTSDIEFITKYYNLNNYIYNIAISQNDNTPVDIINELWVLKNMKYSKIIRSNAEKIRIKYYSNKR